MPKVKCFKVGKSLVLTIPDDIVEELGIYKGLNFKVHNEGNRIVYEPIPTYGSVWRLVPIEDNQRVL